jgi:hypothetical protein
MLSQLHRRAYFFHRRFFVFFHRRFFVVHEEGIKNSSSWFSSTAGSAMQTFVTPTWALQSYKTISIIGRVSS